MKEDRLKELLEKYYDGNSTCEEENELKEFFSGKVIFPGYEAEKEIFTHYSGSELTSMPSAGFEMKIIRSIEDYENRSRRILYKKRYLPLLGAAASIMMIIASWFFIFREKEPEDTFTDPAVAYAQTMKILNHVSMKLNLATEAVTPVVDMANTTLISMKTFGRSLNTFTTGLKKAGLQIPDDDKNRNEILSTIKE